MRAREGVGENADGERARAHVWLGRARTRACRWACVLGCVRECEEARSTSAAHLLQQKNVLGHCPCTLCSALRLEFDQRDLERRIQVGRHRSDFILLTLLI